MGDDQGNFWREHAIREVKAKIRQPKKQVEELLKVDLGVVLLI